MAWYPVVPYSAEKTGDISEVMETISVDGYPSEENGPAGETAMKTAAARIAVTQKIRKTVK